MPLHLAAGYSPKGFTKGNTAARFEASFLPVTPDDQGRSRRARIASAAALSFSSS